MTPEAKVKSAIKKWLDARGFWRAGAARPDTIAGWYFMPQNMGMGVSGLPDFVGSFLRDRHDPTPFAIEAKAPGGKPSVLQLDRHDEMKAAGWLVLVCSDVSQLAELEVHLG